MNSILTIVLLLSLLNVFSCEKCSTELDVDYRGIPYSIDFAYESRRTFQECCAFCDQVSQCMAWTFIYETQVCILKKGLGYRLPTRGSKINLLGQEAAHIILIFLIFMKGISGIRSHADLQHNFSN